jgi:small subunit ribosomal protein S1
VSQLGVTGLQNPADVFAEGDELEMRVTEVDAPNRRIVLEVTRVPKFEGGQPVLPVRDENEENAGDDTGDISEAEPVATDAEETE